MRSLLALSIFALLGLLAAPGTAVACDPHATTCLGEICNTSAADLVGVTTMDKDQKNLIACLKNDAGEFRWKSMSAADSTVCDAVINSSSAGVFCVNKTSGRLCYQNILGTAGAGNPWACVTNPGWTLPDPYEKISCSTIINDTSAGVLCMGSASGSICYQNAGGVAGFSNPWLCYASVGWSF